MSTPSSTGNGTPGKTDFDTLTRDMLELREDHATLIKDTGAFAASQASVAGEKSRELAEDAGEKAIEYREAVADKVREHPLAAIGIALAAGYVLAAMSRRS